MKTSDGVTEQEFVDAYPELVPIVERLKQMTNEIILYVEKHRVHNEPILYSVNLNFATRMREWIWNPLSGDVPN